MVASATTNAPRRGATLPVVPASMDPTLWCDRCDAILPYDEDVQERICGTCGRVRMMGVARELSVDSWADPVFDAVWHRMREAT